MKISGTSVFFVSGLTSPALVNEIVHHADLRKPSTAEEEVAKLQKEAQEASDGMTGGFFNGIEGFWGQDKGQDLQGQGKLGNFEIQRLMSEFNQAQTLSSSDQAKQDDIKDAVFRNLKA